MPHAVPGPSAETSLEPKSLHAFPKVYLRPDQLGVVSMVFRDVQDTSGFSLGSLGTDHQVSCGDFQMLHPGRFGNPQAHAQTEPEVT